MGARSPEPASKVASSGRAFNTKEHVRPNRSARLRRNPAGRNRRRARGVGRVLPFPEAVIRRLRHIPLILPAILAGCEGRQSWLAGAGEEALAVEALFWPFLVGAGVIWTAVMVFAILAYRARPSERKDAAGRRLILWAGAVLPTLIVAALLVTGLATLRSFAAKVPALTVHVDGEQWWWRVVYETSAGTVRTANEIRLPRGETTEFLLTSDDVIHSLWAPAIGGKMDLVPGRTNRLTLTPVATGRWGGACAEYCGGAHAQMRFEVVVTEPEAFQTWLGEQARPAAPEALADEDGLALFLDQGCGACHSVRGTEAAGDVGPDLTHLASRGRIAAGLLPLDERALRRWLRAPEAVKPGAKMPGYPHLSGAELSTLAGFLMALK